MELVNISKVHTELSNTVVLEVTEVFDEAVRNCDKLNPEIQQEEDEMVNEEEDEIVNENEDDVLDSNVVITRSLVSAADSDEPVQASQPVYDSSSRFCRSRISILVCRGVLLLAGAVFLGVGIILAATIRHSNPLNCSTNDTTYANETIDIFTTYSADSRTTTDMPISTIPQL